MAIGRAKVKKLMTVSNRRMEEEKEWRIRGEEGERERDDLWILLNVKACPIGKGERWGRGWAKTENGQEINDE